MVCTHQNKIQHDLGRVDSAVVYKAGHHGARSSNSKIFLDAVKSQYVVISAREGNRFGHPHEELLYRIADVVAIVLLTELLGTIEILTGGEQMRWESNQ